MLVAACTEPGEQKAGSRTSPLVCTGQFNQQVTTGLVKYTGFRESAEHVDFDEANDIDHAAAAELLYSVPEPHGQERFAVAWVTPSPARVYVRRYDTSSQPPGFLGDPQLMSDPEATVAGWVRHMGYDDNCIAMEKGQCAWFTWEEEGSPPLVRFRAIRSDGQLSSPIHARVGRFSSGDTGQIWTGWEWQRRKLLAWISDDQTSVRFAVLDNAGYNIVTNELHKVHTSRRGYQTAVAWDSRERRWLVAWAENRAQQIDPLNGRILTRYVQFDGTPGPDPDPDVPGGPDPDEYILHCEGGWDEPACSQKNNLYCLCYGFWLASSYYSRSRNDRYRLHQYRIHTRLTIDGKRYGTPDSSFASFAAPITEAAFVQGGESWPFQILDRTYQAPLVAIHHRLVQDSFLKRDTQPVTGTGYFIPQAFRSNGSVAVAVATGDLGTPEADELVLSIVDVRRDGCP